MKAVELAYKGFRFAVPAETEAFWPYYGILFVGEYDPLLKSLRRGDIVLDAGANIGIFTLLASRIAELVIAVEPDPENFSYLKYNIELNRAKMYCLLIRHFQTTMAQAISQEKGFQRTFP
jgi:tRNA G37 N-methylase Trm5